MKIIKRESVKTKEEKSNRVKEKSAVFLACVRTCIGPFEAVCSSDFVCTLMSFKMMYFCAHNIESSLSLNISCSKLFDLTLRIKTVFELSNSDQYPGSCCGSVPGKSITKIWLASFFKVQIRYAFCQKPSKNSLRGSVFVRMRSELVSQVGFGIESCCSIDRFLPACFFSLELYMFDDLFLELFCKIRTTNKALR